MPCTFIRSDGRAIVDFGKFHQILTTDLDDGEESVRGMDFEPLLGGGKNPISMSEPKLGNVIGAEHELPNSPVNKNLFQDAEEQFTQDRQGRSWLGKSRRSMTTTQL